MKTIQKWVLRGAICLGLLALPMIASAQSNGNGNGNGNGNAKGKDKPTIDQRPSVIGRDLNSDPATATDDKGKPDKPSRPNNPAPPASVQNAVTSFQAARENYLQQQKALKLQYQAASAEQRQAIRDQIKDLLDKLKEQQKALQEEAKDRAKELKNTLNPDLGRLIDKGTGEGRTK